MKKLLFAVVLGCACSGAGASEFWDTVNGMWVGIFGGSTSASAGTPGAVPAPAAGDQVKFLRGDGTWGAITAGSVGAEPSLGGFLYPGTRFLTSNNLGVRSWEYVDWADIQNKPDFTYTGTVAWSQLVGVPSYSTTSDVSSLFVSHNAEPTAHAGAIGNAVSFSIGNHNSDSNAHSTMRTVWTNSLTSSYVGVSDSRLTDARAPTAHQQGADTIYWATTPTNWTTVDSTLAKNLEGIDAKLGTVGSGGGGGVVVNTYTSSATWMKPEGAVVVEAWVMGGGGGGRAGSKVASSGVAGGGLGGAGASWAVNRWPASSLSSTASVVVGAGGAGGVGSATVGTGANGSTGGNSSVFELIGYGGLATTSTAYSAIAPCFSIYGNTEGQAGAAGENKTNTTGGCAGGSGGSENTATQAIHGSNGGSRSVGWVTSGALGGRADGYGGDWFGAAGAASGQLLIGGGGGGGGGGSDNAGTAGAGGAGGFPGGGGGGGGGAAYSNSAGSGGDGGAGVVVIFTYLGGE